MPKEVSSICKSVTDMEKSCMKFLSNKMEATAHMVGCEIYRQFYEMAPTNFTHIGSGILSSLHRKGLVMRLPELKAWRLTKEGRQYVGARNQ